MTAQGVEQLGCRGAGFGRSGQSVAQAQVEAPAEQISGGGRGGRGGRGCTRALAAGDRPGEEAGTPELLVDPRDIGGVNARNDRRRNT